MSWDHWSPSFPFRHRILDSAAGRATLPVKWTGPCPFHSVLTRFPDSRMSPQPRHVPVLAAEVIRLTDPQPGQTWVDCTVGGGGHSRMIAEQLGDSGRLIGLDQDPTMLARARPGLEGLPVNLVHANFDQL